MFVLSGAGIRYAPTFFFDCRAGGSWSFVLFHAQGARFITTIFVVFSFATNRLHLAHGRLMVGSWLAHGQAPVGA